VRSKISIGKVDNTPPSTIVEVVLATGSDSTHGRKCKGIDSDIRSASATDGSSGSRRNSE
jgi:hypothetical protein